MRCLLSPASVFLGLGTFFGLAFLIVTPPFQSPDEWLHFYRAYQISEGRLGWERPAGAGNGVTLPESLVAFGEAVGALELAFHPENKITLPDLAALRGMPREPTPRRYYDYIALTGAPYPYPPTALLPQAAALASARLLRLGPLASLYLARAFNLAAWLLLVFLALRALPGPRMTFLLCALTPTSVFHAASLSHDAVLNGLTVLWIALVLRLAWEEKSSLTPGLLALLAAILAILGVERSPSLFLLSLWLLVPARKAGGLRPYAAAWAIMTAAGAGAAACWSLGNREALRSIENFFHPGATAWDQLTYVAHHPAAFLRTMAVSLLNLSHLTTFVGRLGWFDTPLAAPIYVLWPALLLATGLLEAREDRPTARERAVLLFCFLATNLSMTILLYLVACPYGASWIPFPGRYLIPFAPLALTCLGGWGRLPAPGVRERLVAVLGPLAAVIVLGSALQSTRTRYYAQIPQVRSARLGLGGAAPRRMGGYLDAVIPHDGRLTVLGWAPWKGNTPAQGLWVLTDAAVLDVKLSSVLRPDVARVMGDARYAESGFRLILTLKDAPRPGAVPRVCVAAHDGSSGETYLLQDGRQEQDRSSCLALLKKRR